MKTGNAKPKEVAEHLSLNVETVRVLAREGVLKDAFKVGSKHSSPMRIPWRSVYEYEKTQPRVSA